MAILVVLLFLAGLMVFPFLWMTVTSSLKLPQILQYPPRLVPGTDLIRNITALVQTVPFVRAFINSLFIAGVATVGQVFLCSLAGFAFAKYEFLGRETLFLLVLATMMIPATVNLIPWFIMMSWLGWTDTYQALIVPGMANAFGIFWMRQSITQAVHDEIIQAARIDGCSEIRIYTRVVVPMVRPALGALSILVFLGVWNEYLQPLIILNTVHKFTLPLILALLHNQYGTQLHLVMVGSTLATVPVLIIFFLTSRWFIRGLTAGALKG